MTDLRSRSVSAVPTDGAFTKRTVVILSFVVAVSLLAFLYLLISGGSTEPGVSSGPDAYSRSAVGHRGFLETLERLGIPVATSRFDSGRRAGHSALLLVLEPEADTEAGQARLKAMVRNADRVLVVLPKRDFTPDAKHPGFVSSTWLRPLSDPQSVLDALGIKEKVVRPGRSPRAAFPADLPHPETHDIQLFAGVQGVAPQRLVMSVTRGRRKLWVLADPDPIENHGFGKGENAAFVVGLVRRLRSGDRPVILDETSHGFSARPSLFAALLRFPLDLALVHAGLLVCLVLFAAVGRFGAPRSEGLGTEPGKTVLLRNTADLLAAGTHVPAVASRYLKGVMAEIARARRAPKGMNDRERTEWLERLEDGRNSDTRIRSLLEEARSLAGTGRSGSERALALARRVHRYREELLHGTGRDPGRDRPPA